MVKRTFLPWDEPLLESVADLLVNRHYQKDRVDLSKLVLVVPGARGGRRLLELLAEKAEDSGGFLVPSTLPVLTPGTLADHLYDRTSLPHPVASRVHARRAWARAVGQTPVETLQEVFPEPTSFAGLTGRNAVAGLLDSLNRTLGGGGRSFSDVAQECRKGLLFSDQERWLALSRIQERYWEILRVAGFLDGDMARHLSLRHHLLAAPGKILLVGVVEMPEILRRMLEALSDQVEALIHAPPSLEDHFDALGLIRPERWIDREIPLEHRFVSLVDRPGDQASAVLSGLVQEDEGLAAEDITIGVPDPEVVPYLEQRLGAYGIPLRYAGGFPLARTAPYRFLAAVGDYLSDRTFQALAGLLRHPALRAHPAHIPSPQEMDAYFGRHLPGRIQPGNLPQDARGGKLASGLQDLHGPELLGPLEGERRLSAWMEEILALLSRVFGHTALSREAPLDRRLIDACLKIRDRAQALHQLPADLDETCQAQEAIRVLLSELEGDALPPEALEEAIELVGWLELHLDDAAVLYITGANEGSLPGSLEVDPFLPNSLRSRLGIPDNHFRFGRDAYLLTAILHSRKNGVRVMAGRRDSRGEPLRPSRYLLTGDGPSLARRVLEFTGEEALSHPPLALEPLALRPESGTGFHLPPEPILPIPELPRPIPVTAFRSLLSDPYLWALERVLRLEETTDGSQELDPLAFGTLAHRVLEVFGRSPEAQVAEPGAVAARLDAILKGVTAAMFGESPLPAIPIQVAQLRARLHSFAEWQASWVAQGWRVRGLEVRTIPEGAPFLVDGEPVYLSGRIDRIDIHQESGEWVIFDYKTGDTAEDPNKTHRNRHGWKDLQLPLYRHLIRYLDDPGLPLPADPEEIPPHRLAFLPLSRKQEAFQPAFASWGAEELAEADDTARELIRRLRRDREVRFDLSRSGSRARGAMATLLGKGTLRTGETWEEEGEGPE